MALTFCGKKSEVTYGHISSFYLYFMLFFLIIYLSL